MTMEVRDKEWIQIVVFLLSGRQSFSLSLSQPPAGHLHHQDVQSCPSVCKQKLHKKLFPNILCCETSSLVVQLFTLYTLLMKFLRG